LPTEYSGTPACERGKYETALQIIQSLANRGSALAEELCDDLCMEAVYYRGEGAPRDYVRAYMWPVVILMKSRFDIKATSLRNEITTKMPTARIAEAQRLAEKWTESHAT
jgi:hypothetical protein